MRCEITDPDVKMLASIAAMLAVDYVGQAKDPWAGSPFGWIKSRPSRQVGKIGEQLVAGWCAAKGFDVTNAGDSEADRVINGRRVEIKFSTLWASGAYTFQQIRDQNYEFVICLGLSPFDAHSWVVPKKVLLQHVIGKTPQHRGRVGTDTFWLSFPPTLPPDWLTPYGGRLSRMAEIIARWM